MDTTTDITEIVDAYLAMWNEDDADARAAIIERTWTPDARYRDPLLEADGYDGLTAMVEGVHGHYPGHRFRRTSGVDAHHDQARFGWELVAPDGSVTVGRPRRRRVGRRRSRPSHHRLLRPAPRRLNLRSRFSSVSVANSETLTLEFGMDGLGADLEQVPAPLRLGRHGCTERHEPEPGEGEPEVATGHRQRLGRGGAGTAGGTTGGTTGTARVRVIRFDPDWMYESSPTSTIDERTPLPSAVLGAVDAEVEDSSKVSSPSRR